MRYFRLFWDGLYAFALGSLAAAGFATVSLCVRKSIEDHNNKKKTSP